MKILFLVPYPTEGASNRVRVEQFQPYLKEKGVLCTVRPFANRRFFKALYLPYRFPEKAVWFVLCTLNRMLDLVRVIRHDIIFIHREAYPFGGAILETLIHKMGKIMVFDFDDAIFLPNTSEHNIYIEKFKRPDKICRIIKMCSLVIAGNNYLKEYALNYNKNAIVIPSCIDTDRYRPSALHRDTGTVVIGWLGSNTTKAFLYNIEGVLSELANKYHNLVFKVVGAKFYSPKLDNIVNVEWSLDEEINQVQSFDIGIMPMPDTAWTKGKCGFKILLYMACGIPVVASRVGVNAEIIEEGLDGYFADSKNEWVEKLSILIEDKDLRRRVGMKGREKVVKKYALDRFKDILYEKFKDVYGA